MCPHCKIFKCTPISFSSYSFPFQDYKEEILVKGNSPIYHHLVIPSSLDLMLKRCLLVVLPPLGKTPWDHSLERPNGINDAYDATYSCRSELRFIQSYFRGLCTPVWKWDSAAARSKSRPKHTAIRPTIRQPRVESFKGSNPESSYGQVKSQVETLTEKIRL